MTPFTSPVDSNSVGMATLRSIFKYGLLCTPERLDVYASRGTENSEKKKLSREGKVEFSHSQSRLCFTLCEEYELYEPKIRGLLPGEKGPVAGGHDVLAHSDLFGPYAVSFDPVVSRRLGIVPTNYFAPSDVFGERFKGTGTNVPGLGIQMIQRLKELRDLMIAIAMIEESVRIHGVTLPGRDVIDALGLTLPFEGQVSSRIKSLSYRNRLRIVELLDIDREVALNLVSFTEMMLSLFQETDSTIDGRILAFYQQREWRLIHHMRPGMVWYCLGHQPEFRNPLSNVRRGEIEAIRQALQSAAEGRDRSPDYFRHCWLLEAVDGSHVREYVSTVIVPANKIDEASGIVRETGSDADIVPAEDFGYHPGGDPS